MQLGSIKWGLDSKGRIKIESKDDIKKRGMPSPDRVDALMMTLQDAGLASIEVDAHNGESIMDDIMTKAW